jgi:superfamily II DNA or RNA helicase
MTDGFDPGTEVRLIDDPGRIGTVTQALARTRGASTLIQVRFGTGPQWVSLDALEALAANAEDPLALLETGRFGGVAELRRVLTHVRLTGRLANLIYSMNTTGTDFYAHQFKPVLKLLNSPARGILIADEVGLGKTIEAGLLWTELRTRFDYRRLLVVCPAMLREKWVRELRQRFGVDAQLADAEEVLRLLQTSESEGAGYSFAAVCSLQGLRPPRDLDDPAFARRATTRLAKYLADREGTVPLVDVLIVDEAHYLRNPETSTSRLGYSLRHVSDYALLLSATPIQLRNRDLFTLLQLVDQDTFYDSRVFDEVLFANEPLVHGRDLVLGRRSSPDEIMEVLQRAQGHPLLSKSQQLASILSKPPTLRELRDPAFASDLARKLERMNILGHAVTRTRKRDVHELRVIREPLALAVKMNDIEREFYRAVTEIVRRYCAGRRAHEGFLLVTPQRQMSSSMPAALRRWRRVDRAITLSNDELLEGVYEDLGIDDDVDPRDIRPLLTEIAIRTDQLVDYAELAANDTKYERLRALLFELIGRNRDEKIVLFSYFRDTLDYLHERLEVDGVNGVVLKGGVQDKDAIVRTFAAAGGPNILLSSEVGSEGIDLQFAWLMVNYDLPWNPMRVEQRIGRIDRLGQRAPQIRIFNFYYDDTIDARIYQRLFRRLHFFEAAFGALEPILGEQIQKLGMDLLSANLTPQQELERIEQTVQAIENRRRIEEDLEREAASLTAYGDYILNEVKAARELSRRITEADIFSYVSDYFTINFRGCRFERQSGNTYLVTLSNEAKHALEKFLERTRQRTRLTQASPSPVRCRFENSMVGADDHREEVVNQIHPIVRYVGDAHERQRVWLHPTAAVRLATEALPVSAPAGDYVFTVQRWSIEGVQDIEQLYFTLVPLDGGVGLLPHDDAERIVVAAASVGLPWRGAENQVDLARAAHIANDVGFLASDAAYTEFVSELRVQNADRAEFLLEALERQTERQMATMRRVQENHREEGRTGLVAAQEGKMRALRARSDRRRIQIEDKRLIRSQKDELFVGVIRVG